MTSAGVCSTSSRLQEVQVSGLLVGDARGGVHHREVGMAGQARHRLRRRVERVEVELAVAVGAEVEAAADPHRVGVVAAALGLGDLLRRVALGVEEHQARSRAAPVVLPLVESLVDREVGDGSAVRRDRRLGGVGNRQSNRLAALHRHREELLVAARVDLAGGREQHRLAVRGEAEGGIRARVPGESLRHSALGRHNEHVGVAFVAAGEGDQLPVRREARPRLDAGVRGQAARAGAVEVRHPEVVRIGESDPVRADRGVGQEARIPGVHGERRGGGEE
jgi:hypothetical protein